MGQGTFFFLTNTRVGEEISAVKHLCSGKETMTTNQLASSRDVMRSDYRLNNLSMKVFLLSNQ
jgi:hypothetical protein